MYRSIISILFSLYAVTTYAQRVTVEKYIDQFKDIAMSEMKRTGVPASITLAQGILESENGNGDLVKKSNNHFGIKCKNNWEGESVTHDDDANGECFRAYANAADSYRDHSDFLKSNKRYGALFELDPGDYEGWAKGLKKAGYATNPRYPDLLIKYIQQYDLQQYSMAVLNELPKMDIAKTAADNKDEVPEEIKEEKQGETKTGTTVETEVGLVTSINSTKCVFVKKGTSLLVVANKNNIGLNKLMEFNDMTEEGILNKDQYIYLHKKPKTGDKEFYIVQPGETLYDIAQKNGIQLKYLVEYNNLSSNEKINVNTKIYLQPGDKLVSNDKQSTERKTHLVAPKEGLYAIARVYNVTVQQLREWNKLVSDELKIGQKIFVSK